MGERKLTMVMKGKLSNSELPKELDGVVSSYIVVANYAQFVLQQGDVKHITALENLSDHQKLARKHAHFWEDSIEPKIQRTVTDTITFSKVFLKTCDKLQSLIDRMKKGEEKARDEFTTNINVLVAKLEVVIEHTEDVVINVAKFKAMLSEDTRDFQQDLNEAQKTLIGDNEDKKALQSQLGASTLP